MVLHKHASRVLREGCLIWKTEEIQNRRIKQGFQNKRAPDASHRLLQAFCVGYFLYKCNPSKEINEQIAPQGIQISKFSRASIHPPSLFPLRMGNQLRHSFDFPYIPVYFHFNMTQMCSAHAFSQMGVQVSCGRPLSKEKLFYFSYVAF